MNAGVRADFLPDPFPEFGQCPHKMLAHPSMPERLYQQNHCGFFRSDDGGRQWLDMSEGLPSRFGFVVGTHSTDPDTIYVVPEDKALKGEDGGGIRYVTDAKFQCLPQPQRRGGLGATDQWSATAGRLIFT